MNKLLFALGVLGAATSVGCGTKRVAECDDFVATIDQIAKCPSLPEGSRSSIERSAQQIKDTLKLIDDAGGVGDAPASVVQTLRDTCKTQQKAVAEQYKKLMPDCVK